MKNTEVILSGKGAITMVALGKKKTINSNMSSKVLCALLPLDASYPELGPRSMCQGLASRGRKELLGLSSL